jgi:serine/threonine protein kinase
MKRKFYYKHNNRKIKFMVHLYASFQTEEILYIAMDFCAGGDLREMLEVIGVLEDKEAQLWFAEMICAVNALHDLNYIHRDLKPENFFIDGRGHIKLGDFGLSAADKQQLAAKKFNTQTLTHRERLTIDNFNKRFQSTYQSLVGNSTIMRRPVIVGNPMEIPTRKQLQAYSIVGSPEFMSPEVIKLREKGIDLAELRKLTEGYSYEVDWWSLGCVFYTCILGGPPFSGEDIEDIFKAIVSYEKLLPDILGQYSDQLSEGCYSLLAGFLTEPSKRLGKDINKLKAHPFFEGLDWDHLDQIKSEYIPCAAAGDK